MKRSRFLVLMLAFISMPTMMLANFGDEIDRVEFGFQAGVGFYVGPTNPLGSESVLRVQAYDVLRLRSNDANSFGWPGIETFGASLGYRFDTRWQLRLQANRQRMYYIEMVENNQYPFTYYNSMWHVDAIAEFNILNYTNATRGVHGAYNIVPYVGLGLGVTIYNQNATLRSIPGTGGDLKNSTTFPGVGGKDNPLAAAAYIPLVLGGKWRVTDNVQLKASFQYNLYLNGNLEGGFVNPANENGDFVVVSKANGNELQYQWDYIEGPSFAELNKNAKFGDSHNFMFSLGVILNFGKWYEERIVTY
jgi:hypothetical protein